MSHRQDAAPARATVVEDAPSGLGHEAVRPLLQSRHWPETPRSEFGLPG